METSCNRVYFSKYYIWCNNDKYMLGIRLLTCWPHKRHPTLCHDEVIKWKHFPLYWQFVRGSHRSPMTWSFDVFFDLCLNKRWSKQSWDSWFETPSCPLCRHTNGPHGQALDCLLCIFWRKWLCYKAVQLNETPLKSLKCTEACVIKTLAEPAGQVSDREIFSAQTILSNSHKGISRGDGVHIHMTTGLKHGGRPFWKVPKNRIFNLSCCTWWHDMEMFSGEVLSAYIEKIHHRFIHVMNKTYVFIYLFFIWSQ